MAKDMYPHDESMHHDDMHDEMHDSETVMVPKSICPDMEFKPGDEMILKVKSVKGDMLEMEYAPGDDSEEMPSDHDAMNMPLDKLEKRLPTADREM